MQNAGRKILIILTMLLLASCGVDDTSVRNERTKSLTKKQQVASEDAVPESDARVYSTDASGEPVPDISDVRVPTEWPELDDTCYKADAFVCLIEYTIMQETNAHRVALAPLEHKYQISFTAREWSEKQRLSNLISHTGFPDSRIMIMVDEFSTTGSVQMWAENVALSWSDSDDPIEIGKMITNLWWTSPVHKQNMVGNYSAVGVGVVKNGNNYWATQIFGVSY